MSWGEGIEDHGLIMGSSRYQQSYQFSHIFTNLTGFGNENGEQILHSPFTGH